MIELRDVLKSELVTILPKVYFQYAALDKPFPQIVYNFLPSYMADAGMEVFMMDVDVWDNDTDTTLIETLAQSIWEKFNKYSYIDDTIQFAIYRNNRFPPIEEDEVSIRRRKLTFEVRYLYKGGRA